MIIIYKNKTITIWLLLIIIIYFGLYFIGINILFNQTFNINYSLDTIKQNVEDDNWISANRNFEQMDKFWENTKYIFELNFSDQNLSDVNMSINNLNSALKACNEYESILYLDEIDEYYNNQLCSIPLP